MSASGTARSRVRAELTQEIKAAARRQLAAEGAAQLSLRAVARELQMVPSALYRYFPNRDELLTALIVEAYDALGQHTEQAVAALPATDAWARWSTGCQAMRSWSVAHPHEYALLYGSPVPGYRAPSSTISPATRVFTLLLEIVRDAGRSGQLFPAAGPALLPGLEKDGQLLCTALDVDDLDPTVIVRTVSAWTHLIGALSTELFGHLEGAFTDNTAFFDDTVALTAHLVGLRQ